MLSTGHGSFLLSLQIAFRGLLKSCISFHSCYTWGKYFFKGMGSIISLSPTKQHLFFITRMIQSCTGRFQNETEFNQSTLTGFFQQLFKSNPPWANKSQSLVHINRIVMQSLSKNQKWFMFTWRDVWLNNGLNPAFSCQRYLTHTYIASPRHRPLY